MADAIAGAAGPGFANGETMTTKPTDVVEPAASRYVLPGRKRAASDVIVVHPSAGARFEQGGRVARPLGDRFLMLAECQRQFLGELRSRLEALDGAIAEDARARLKGSLREALGVLECEIANATVSGRVLPEESPVLRGDGHGEIQRGPALADLRAACEHHQALGHQSGHGPFQLGVVRRPPSTGDGIAGKVDVDTPAPRLLQQSFVCDLGIPIGTGSGAIGLGSTGCG